jgi:hypothetical protein
METTMEKKLEDKSKMIDKLTEDNDELKYTITTMETTMGKKLENKTKMMDKLTGDNEELK